MGLKNSTYKRIFLVGQALFLPPLFIYTVLLEPYWIRAREIAINEPDNPVAKAFTGIKVLHLSDLHINKMGRREKKTLEIIDNLSPDIIFVTGDYLDYAGYTRGALEFMDELNAPYGVFGILGNVDYREPGNAEMLYERYRMADNPRRSLTILKNETTLISPAGHLIRIIGIDDPIIYKNDEMYIKAIAPAFEVIKEDIPTLLLAHRPNIFSYAQAAGVNLSLCGHTHGGQMRLPFSLQFYNQSTVCKTYNRGLYRIGDMLMHVSPGIGTSDVPMRFLCRPEVTLFSFA